MREKLIIFIHAEDLNHPSWVVIDHEFHIQESIQSGEPTNLSSLAIDKKVMVIVPAQDVLLTTVNLPKMNKSKLLQALPFALEDQVISDVDTLHFVPEEQKIIHHPVGDRRERIGEDELTMIPISEEQRGEQQKMVPGALSVTIIAKEKMQHYMELLKSWAIQPDVMMSSTFALPVTDKTWHILNDETVVVRTGNYHGFVIDKNNFNEIINIALASSESPPQLLYIHQLSSDPRALQLNSNIDIKIDSYSIERLAENACKYPIINLLQGFYKNKKSRFPQIQKIQRVTVTLIATWLGLLFLYPIVSYFMLYQKADDLNDQIKKIYTYHFPQSTSMVAPKIRMEDKLKKIISNNENRFFMLLHYLGEAMKNDPGIKLKRLDFQNDQLILEVTAVSSENFAGFTEFLIREGAQVKEQSATVIGDGINAIIAVK